MKTAYESLFEWALHYGIQMKREYYNKDMVKQPTGIPALVGLSLHDPNDKEGLRMNGVKEVEFVFNKEGELEDFYFWVLDGDLWRAAK